MTEHPEWLSDARFEKAAGRRQHEREVNDLIAEWTRGQDATALMYRLQQGGVHAAVVNTVRDLFSDPQIRARGIWQEREHPVIGAHHYRMGVFS